MALTETRLDKIIGVGSGVGSRPTAGQSGARWIDTTGPTESFDNGTSWVNLAGSTGPAGELGHVTLTSAFSTSSTTPVDVTSFSVTVTVGSRPILVTVYFPLCDITAGSNVRVDTILVESSTVLQGASVFSTATSQGASATMIARLTPSAGAHTYKVQASLGVGSGTGRLFASTTSPMIMTVVEV